jgi:hypothetical protein
MRCRRRCRKLRNQRCINGEKDILYDGKKESILQTVKSVTNYVPRVSLSVMVHLPLLRSVVDLIDCRLNVHHRCLDAVTLPCLSPANFSPDRIRAAFLRCFASMLYNYRKYMEPIAPNDRRPHDVGKHSNFKASAFTRAAPRDSVHFLDCLLDTQAFNEFILERCSKPPDDPEIILFDQIITAKRNRGRHGLFQKQRPHPHPPCPCGETDW